MLIRLIHFVFPRISRECISRSGPRLIGRTNSYIRQRQRKCLEIFL